MTNFPLPYMAARIPAPMSVVPHYHTPAIAFDIMLADDDKDDRFFFDKAVEELDDDSHLTVVKDGVLLIEYFAAHPGYMPDVIFMDMQMPRMDGIDCLAAIKSDPRLRDIPVVIHSTSTTNADVDILYALGAHYYMDKSSFSALTVCIKNILTLLVAGPAQPAREDFVISHCG